MVELLIVILIIAVLIALLVPALAAAVRRTRQASVTSEINVLATDLAQFKSAYGFFPPSRLYISEAGLFPPITNTTSLASPGTTDITAGQLGARSIRYLQRMFPRVAMSTVAAPTILTSAGTTGGWYDFNGNGGTGPDPDYILRGDQCLVFFLGGVPIYDPSLGTYTGMGGFGKNPINPFTNSIAGNAMVSLARTTPIAEFKNSRLGVLPGGAIFPSYFDAAGGGPAPGNSTVYAYFSSYEGAGYDANDVNILESDPSGLSPILLSFTPNAPVFDSTGAKAALAISPSPNPYTASLTIGGGGVVSYQSPQSYQIISAGADGEFGPGGQYLPNSPQSTVPIDTQNNPYNSSDASVRGLERDNLTSFATGPLG